MWIDPRFLISSVWFLRGLYRISMGFNMLAIPHRCFIEERNLNYYFFDMRKHRHRAEYSNYVFAFCFPVRERLFVSAREAKICSITRTLVAS